MSSIKPESIIETIAAGSDIGFTPHKISVPEAEFDTCVVGGIDVGTRLEWVGQDLRPTAHVTFADVTLSNARITAHDRQYTLLDPGADSELVDTLSAQTLSNKSIVDANFKIVGHDDSTKIITFQSAGAAGTATTITANQTDTRNIELPDADTTLVGRDTADILENKTLVDATTVIGNAGGSDWIAFNAAGAAGTATTITSSQTVNRIITLPDADTNLIGHDTTDTLTNKSFIDTNSLIVSASDQTRKIAFSVGGGVATTTTIETLPTVNRTIVLPDANTTLVGRDTTDTFTNKSLVDSNTQIVDSVDQTKKIIFDVGGNAGTTTTITSGQTANRVITLPNATSTLATTTDLANYVTLNTTQSISGLKTFSATTTFINGMYFQSLLGGSWINMPTTGPSGIGHGGAGVNPWIARSNFAGEWFTTSVAGDVCQRNTAGRILVGCIEAMPTMVISSGANRFTIQNNGFGAILNVKSTNETDISGVFNFVAAPNISAVTNGAASLTMPGSTGTIALTSDVDQSCAWFGNLIVNADATPIPAPNNWYVIVGTYTLDYFSNFSQPSPTVLKYDGAEKWFTINYSVTASCVTQPYFSIGIVKNAAAIANSEASGVAPAGAPLTLSKSIILDLETNDELILVVKYLGGVAEDITCFWFSMNVVEIK